MLLKTLSDSSEKVVIKDLQLLAQISSFSDDSYFNNFMVSLLRLFSTDRKLLENRGSLMIRQMCVNMTPDVIYRSLSEVLEREEVRLLPIIRRAYDRIWSSRRLWCKICTAT